MTPCARDYWRRGLAAMLSQKPISRAYARDGGKSTRGVTRGSVPRSTKLNAHKFSKLTRTFLRSGLLLGDSSATYTSAA